MWIVTAVFQQSYTVFVAMVIIPYTRKSWRVYGAILFILTAWWVYSWAWYSITGLLLADAVMNMGFREKSKAGISLGPIWFPAWPLYIAVMAAGWIMQFVWVAARPDLANEEIKYHTGLYATGGLYTWNDPNNPQLRADVYLIVIGFFGLLEHFDWMRTIFANPVFRFLGKRSFGKQLPRPLRGMSSITNDLCSILPAPIHHHLHPGHQAVHRQYGRKLGELHECLWYRLHFHSACDNRRWRSVLLADRVADKGVCSVCFRLDSGMSCLPAHECLQNLTDRSTTTCILIQPYARFPITIRSPCNCISSASCLHPSYSSIAPP